MSNKHKKLRDIEDGIFLQRKFNTNVIQVLEGDKDRIGEKYYQRAHVTNFQIQDLPQMHHFLPKSKENITILKAGNEIIKQIAYKEIAFRITADISPTRVLKGVEYLQWAEKSYYQSRDQYLMKLSFNNNGKMKTKKKHSIYPQNSKL